MVRIRLRREGKPKQPRYRVVVADSRSPRDGRFIEIIGQYNPLANPSDIAIDGEKALAWLRKGAQPSEQVKALLKRTGVWTEYVKDKGPAKRPPKPKKRLPTPAKAEKKSEAAPATKPAAAPPAAAEAPAESEPAAEVPEVPEVPAVPEVPGVSAPPEQPAQEPAAEA